MNRFCPKFAIFVVAMNVALNSAPAGERPRYTVTQFNALTQGTATASGALSQSFTLLTTTFNPTLSEAPLIFANSKVAQGSVGGSQTVTVSGPSATLSFHGGLGAVGVLWGVAGAPVSAGGAGAAHWDILIHLDQAQRLELGTTLNLGHSSEVLAEGSGAGSITARVVGIRTDPPGEFTLWQQSELLGALGQNVALNRGLDVVVPPADYRITVDWSLSCSAGPSTQFGQRTVAMSFDLSFTFTDPPPFGGLPGGCPGVQVQSSSQSAAVGQAAAFTVFATGMPELQYQWRKDGEPLIDAGSIAGATTDTLTIDPLMLGDAGEYDVVVSNQCGSDHSDPIVLTVLACPADVSGNKLVNVDDLLAVINAWGGCPVPPEICSADIAPPVGNGIVNIDDLLAVINGWGACP
jgi:hypothetical protein